MSAIFNTSPGKVAKSPYVGPLDWRTLVEWLSEDGIISQAESARTIARCSQVQSAQPPLIRLASVSMTRMADGKPLDMETMAQWLAGRAKLNYLRIDPLKVDVGKVADAMSAIYAERHKVLFGQWIASHKCRTSKSARQKLHHILNPHWPRSLIKVTLFFNDYFSQVSPAGSVVTLPALEEL